MSNFALPTTVFERPHIVSFGLNYQTATVAVREQLAFTPQQAAEILAQMRLDFPKTEIALLATCNRTEWYLCSAEDIPDVGDWLVNHGYLEAEQVQNNTFCYDDRHAVRHLYRVACGLDSLILGEPQILGQLKSAYRLAKSQGTLGSALERLFQQSFAVAKHIRHTTAIGENPISVAYAGVKLTHQFFDDHQHRSALIIGAGETGQLVARYLRDLNLKRIIIANRTLAKAQILAEEVGGFAISLTQIHEHLHDVDMIFGAAQMDELVLHSSHIQQALKKRHHAFMVLVDLSLPRIFDTQIEQLDNAFLYGIDDLEQIVDVNRENRQKAARQAEVMIHLHSDDFIGWLNSKPQQHLIRHIRQQADTYRQELLNEAYRRLALGEDPALILEQMSYKLTNKLLHSPSAMIHAIPPDHKDWLAIVADTFDKERNNH